jgi:hypothetical protein
MRVASYVSYYEDGLINVKRNNQTLTAANPLPNTSATPSPISTRRAVRTWPKSGADRLGLSLLSC